MTLPVIKNYQPALLVPLFYSGCAVFSAIFASARWRQVRVAVSSYAAFLAMTGAAVIMYLSSSSLNLVETHLDKWFGGIGFSFAIDFTSALFMFVMAAAVFVYFIFHISDYKSDGYTTLYLLAAASGVSAIAAGDFFTLLFFWGITLALLYLILQKTDELTAQKALFVLGAADFLMLLGIVLISKISLTYNISEALAKLPPDGGKLVLIGLGAIAVSAVAKSGAMPFHNWIISSAEDTSPVGNLIIYPAIIDKALGIYLLVRILPAMMQRINFFQPFLVILGGASLIIAVLMALAQHNLKKLLAYHSISQVGYMLLGLASFNPVGILGGIFHMINNIAYKSGLFMGVAAIEREAETVEMAELSSIGGGILRRKMPRTFISMLVSSLAISGVPPMNGFVSKWLIFQGLLLASATDTNVWYIVVALFTAMIGSSLTMASFIKVIHSVFLTPPSPSGLTDRKKEGVDSKISCWLPQGIMAFVSVALGVGATFYVGIPMLGETSLAAFLILLVALVGGVILYQFKIQKSFRRSEIFFGGEKYSGEYVFSGSDFYKTVEEIPLLSGSVYATRKYGDSVPHDDNDDNEAETGGLYGLTVRTIKFLSSILYYGVERVIYVAQILIVKATEGIIGLLRAAHTGELYLYLVWYLVGAVVLMWIFIK